MEHIRLEPTEEWKDLMREAEKKGIPLDIEKLEKECRSVYRRDSDGSLTFVCGWNPNMVSYDEGAVTLPITGTYAGEGTFNAGDMITNVPGTHNDQNEYKMSWIGMLGLFYEIRYPYDPNDHNNPNNRDYHKNLFRCSLTSINKHYQDSQSFMCGGHVYNQNADNRANPHISGGIYILPICPAHNSSNGQFYIVNSLWRTFPVIRLKNVIHW